LLVSPAHWSTHGRRDFAFQKDLLAERYDIVVRRDNAVEAVGLLGVHHDDFSSALAK
jgi:hypothetical protein